MGGPPHWSQKYGGMLGVERAKIQINICKKDYTKGMIRFDLNMDMMKYMASLF